MPLTSLFDQHLDWIEWSENEGGVPGTWTEGSPCGKLSPCSRSRVPPCTAPGSFLEATDYPSGSLMMTPMTCLYRSVTVWIKFHSTPCCHGPTILWNTSWSGSLVHCLTTWGFSLYLFCVCDVKTSGNPWLPAVFGTTSALSCNTEQSQFLLPQKYIMPNTMFQTVHRYYPV